jgi:DNA-directed RNA polymerase specialized sigma24 family protein
LVGVELDLFGNESQCSQRQAALVNCMEKLSFNERGLIHWRYFENRSYQDIAERAGKRLGTIYTVFSRLHRLLSRCVARHLEAP